jgi:hypothetical protein
MSSPKSLTPLAALLALAFTAQALSGCGPIQSSQAIREAEKAHDAATLTEAKELAPYQYYRSEAYLTLAKRKAGFSEFEISQEYAKIAKESAAKAVEVARKRHQLQQILEQRRAGGTR